MNTTGTYTCGYDNPAALPPETAERMGLSFPQMHCNAADMASLASAICEERGDAVCSLPFCCTVEAEAFGADINMEDATFGPRTKAHRYGALEELLDLEPLDFGKGRIREVLEACRIIKSRGGHVSIEISGPITILNSLIDVSKIFKGWKKQPELMECILRRMGDELYNYTAEALKSGADVISFADPTGAIGIIGPKYARLWAEIFCIPFLKKAEKLLGGKSVMQICPRSSHMMVGMELAKWEHVSLGRPMRYDEACLAAVGKLTFIGESCVKNRSFRLPGGIMQEFVLL